MEGFSIIMPCEKNRFDLLSNTLEKYKAQGLPDDVEFLIISRTLEPKTSGCVRIINYQWDGMFFSTSLPMNIGVREAKYPNLIITCPEVMPKTEVLSQFSRLERGNYVAQVFDENEFGNSSFSLVNTNFRSETPAMYFLACFKKEDIEAINGWDEDFMGTYAWEDTDFGSRFARAGLPFKVLDEIQGIHQYHPRGYSSQEEGLRKARALYEDNNKEGIIRPKNGLVKE
jgi:hypothetical protein